MAEETTDRKARAIQLVALERLRRIEKVSYAVLAEAYGRSESWLWFELQNQGKGLKSSQVKELRRLILELAGKGKAA